MWHWSLCRTDVFFSVLSCGAVCYAVKFRGIRRFVVSGNIRSEGINRLRYSDLIAVKARDFFNETSPRTFVTRGVINSCCFRRDKYICRSECKTRSASIFSRRAISSSEIRQIRLHVSGLKVSAALICS